jgi:hypothetical protein
LLRHGKPFVHSRARTISPGAAGAIGRAEPLRYDAFAAELRRSQSLASGPVCSGAPERLGLEEVTKRHVVGRHRPPLDQHPPCLSAIGLISFPT